MLKHLSIKNYALIEALSVSFNHGFTVVTGETGSGKSILLGALGLILGERADLNSLRNKDEKCVIEGIFQLEKKKYKSFFELNDIDFDIETILRREITPSGKSRAFINDTPVNLVVLKELGEQLIDIHSQHQTQRINTANFQYQVLDVASNSQKVLNEYLVELKSFDLVKKKISELEELQQKAIAEQDYIKFQLEELSAVDLSLDKEELEQEYNLLANAEDVIRVSNEAIQIINDDQNGIVNSLQQLEFTLSKLEKVDVVYSDLIKRVKSTSIELQDIDFELSNKISSLEVDEERLLFLDELLGDYNRLEKKYNAINLEELLVIKGGLEGKNGKFNSVDSELKELNKEAKLALSKVLAVGKQLTELRKSGVKVLEGKIIKTLKDLSMPNAIFNVVLSPLENPSSFGMESIDFQISTNKGTEFNSLKKVASGGELSRIMLSIKMILAEKGMLPTLIFDEIDTGVSGDVANKMGDIMKAMGRKMQVMSITHLPQVASKGASHLRVYKKDENNITNTYIEILTQEERLIEIAKMLSGNKPTDAALNNAKELLN